MICIIVDGLSAEYVLASSDSLELSMLLCIIQFTKGAGFSLSSFFLTVSPWISPLLSQEDFTSSSWSCLFLCRLYGRASHIRYMMDIHDGFVVSSMVEISVVLFQFLSPVWVWDLSSNLMDPIPQQLIAGSPDSWGYASHKVSVLSESH